jgi:hypothetical protein
MRTHGCGGFDALNKVIVRVSSYFRIWADWVCSRRQYGAYRNFELVDFGGTPYLSSGKFRWIEHTNFKAAQTVFAHGGQQGEVPGGECGCPRKSAYADLHEFLRGQVWEATLKLRITLRGWKG